MKDGMSKVFPFAGEGVRQRRGVVVSGFHDSRVHYPVSLLPQPATPSPAKGNYFVALILCFILLTISGCTVKPTPVVDAKEEVIARVHELAPSACEYNGRVKLRYLDQMGQIKASALVNKDCSGDMGIKVLGLFGMVLAEIGVQDGTYTVIRKGEDITGDFAIAITREDVVAMQRAMTLPPVLPDESFQMLPYANGYVFVKDNASIYVDSAYRIGAVVGPVHSAEYRWNGFTPESITVSRTDMVIELTFSDEWKLD